MIREQEFRKQTEEAKFEAFSVMCEKVNELEKENAELKGQVETTYEVYNDNLDYSCHIEEQLTEAKKVIEELYNIIPASMSDYAKEPMEHAKKFMTENK